MTTRRRATLVLAAAVVALLLVLWLRERRTEEPVLPSPPVAAAAYRLRFTEPVYPQNRAAQRGGLDGDLVALIAGAKKSIDMAIYDLDLMPLAKALTAAQARGVRVRLVTDSDTVAKTKDDAIQAAFAELARGGVPVVQDERDGIMHHKFTIVDGAVVATGSWNYTTGDTYRLNNVLAILPSVELARTYANEFEKMFTKRAFGPAKARNAAPGAPVQLGEARVRVYFSPEDDVVSAVEGALRQAQTSVHFLAFAFTHDGIGAAMRERATAGVAVSGVFESTGSRTRYSEFGGMKAAGLDVYADANPYIMHEKVIVIDGRTTVFGSFNFTDNAARSNDENLVLVDDPAFAARFEAEFRLVRGAAQAKLRLSGAP